MNMADRTTGAYITTGINHLLQIMQIITILLPTMQTVQIVQGIMIL